MKPKWVMKPKWRTKEVVIMCEVLLAYRVMAGERTFPLMGLLADALEEADCKDEDLLGEVRGEKDPVLQERLVNIIWSEESEAAVDWLENLGHQIGRSRYEDEPSPKADYKEMVEAGGRAITASYHCWGTDAGSEFFNGNEENRAAFFRNWALVTGVREPGEEKQKSITFRCAC